MNIDDAVMVQLVACHACCAVKSKFYFRAKREKLSGTESVVRLGKLKNRNNTQV